MTRLIAIASGKGGVGKTTTVANLGVALARLDQNVIILDANFTTPNLGLHLGIHKHMVTLNEVLDGRANLVDAIYLHESGLRIIPAGLSMKHAHTADPDRLWDAVQELFGTADFVLLDTPAGLEQGAKAVLDSSEEALLVTNPETPAVMDVLRTARVAQQSGAAVLGVALNKIMDDKHEMQHHEVEAMLDAPVLAKIPFDRNVSRAVQNQKAVVDFAPKSDAAKAYRNLAATIAGPEFELEAEGRPVLRVLKRMLGFSN